MHMRLMALNYQLVERLNPGIGLRWRIVDNRNPHINKGVRRSLLRHAPTAADALGDPGSTLMSKEQKGRLYDIVERQLYDVGEARDYLPAAALIDGLTPSEALAYFTGEKVNADDQDKRRVYRALSSYHHAAALNRALEAIETRYAIVIDPDFYVVEPNWIATVISAMEKSGAALLGAPWHPRWFQKYRDFPCVHFMVVDREALELKRDLLDPDLSAHERYLSPFWEALCAQSWRLDLASARRILRNLPTAIREGRRQRRTIGTRRDTGFALKQHFAADAGRRFAMLTPVFDASAEAFVPSAVSRWQSNRVREAFLPKALRYVPDRARIAKRGFREAGFPDVRGSGWEEFLLGGKPFAFHVRGEHQRKSVGGHDPAAVKLVADRILAMQGEAPLAEPVPAPAAARTNN